MLRDLLLEDICSSSNWARTVSAEDQTQYCLPVSQVHALSPGAQ